MPIQSALFKDLHNSVEDLKRIYLPTFNATNIYAAEEQERTRAFVVLTHAEIEYFVEESFRTAAHELVQAFYKGVITPVTFSFLTFSNCEPLGAGENIVDGKKKTRTVHTRMGEALKLYFEILDGNQGIREKHLSKLLVPFGLVGKAIDSVWLNEIEKLCAARGAFAHMSRTTAEATPLKVNPQDAWNTVMRIIYTDPKAPNIGQITSLQDLDAWLANFHLTIAQPATNASSHFFIEDLVTKCVSFLKKKFGAA